VFACLLVIGTFVFIGIILPADSNSPTTSKDKTAVTTDNGPASSSAISAFPCDGRSSVSPIDGKPCKEKDVVPVAVPPDSSHTVAGTYLGTVHNQTVGFTSSFAAVLYQKKAGVLDGCVDVKPPLYGSGSLHGNIRGSHVDFVVADIRFQRVSLKNEIAGSYIVSGQDGQQLGDFRLTKQPGAETQYGCTNGKLTGVETTPTPASVGADLRLPYEWESVCPADVKGCTPSLITAPMHSI
jgi:hypothetical protein